MNSAVQKILFSGLNTVDIQFRVDKFPLPNTKTKANHHGIYAGGPATNAAIACAALGESVDLISPLGKHALSDFICKDITRRNVNLIDPIRHIESKPVFASIITAQSSGDRTIFSYLPDNHTIRRYHDLPNLSCYKLAMFDGFYPELATDMAEKLKKKGISTLLDGGSWKPGLKELLPHIDMAICSNDFHPPGTGLKEEVFAFMHASGIRDVAITRGNKSILVSQEGKITETAVNPVAAIDTLGAGDIFHGAFCFYYAKGNNFKDSLEKASFVAGESCKTFGTRDWISSFQNIQS